MKKLLHFFPTISHLGGVETILNLHIKQDAAFGWESKVLIGCESDEICRRHGAEGLGIRGWKNTAALRRGFSRFYDACQPDVLICHNLWAGRHLLPLATRSMNVGFVHTASQESWIAMGSCRRDLDMVIAVSPQIAAKAKEIIGGNVLIKTVDVPIQIPPVPPPRHRPRGAPFVIGYCGRIVIEQKRSDRLVDIIEKTLQASPDIRFEIMGDGPYRPTLQQRLGDNPRVAVLGRKSGDDYWKRLQSWDAMILTSDYEGGPIVLFEALSQGVVPVYPRIDSPGDAYTQSVDPSLLYEREDIAAAAAKLVYLSQMEDSQLDLWRAKGGELTLKNRPDKYLATFFSHLEAGLTAGRHAQSAGSTRTVTWRDYVPFFLVRKLMPRWVY